MGRILVASDDPKSRAALGATLGVAGHEVVEVDDGERALAVAVRRRPDVVILDVRGLGRRGLDICRAIHEHPVLGEVGIIILGDPGITRPWVPLSGPPRGVNGPGDG